MENLTAAPRRFELTKLEERVAPTTLHFGAITIDYNFNGKSISGSITLPGGHTYGGSIPLPAISLGAYQSQISSFLSHFRF